MPHRFRNLVEEFLYQSIQLYVRFSEDEIRNPPPHHHDPSSLKCFSRLRDHLQVNPTLASPVQALHLPVPNNLWYWVLYSGHEKLMMSTPVLKHSSLSSPPLLMAIPSEFLPLLQSIRFAFDKVGDHCPLYRNWLAVGAPLEITAKHLYMPTLRKVQAENVWFSPFFDRERFLPPQNQRISPVTIFDSSIAQEACRTRRWRLSSFRSSD